MPVTVEHRPDRLLEMAVRGECPARLKGTFIDQVTWPVHRAAHQFLEEQLVGKTFADDSELQAVLDTWPQFAEGKVPRLSKDFATLRVKGEVITFPECGLGGGLQIALIKEA